jgi:hypothetical protein
VKLISVNEKIIMCMTENEELYFVDDYGEITKKNLPEYELNFSVGGTHVVYLQSLYYNKATNYFRAKVHI